MVQTDWGLERQKYIGVRLNPHVDVHDSNKEEKIVDTSKDYTLPTPPVSIFLFSTL